MAAEVGGAPTPVLLVGGEPADVVGPARAAWARALGRDIPLAGSPTALRLAGGDTTAEGPDGDLVLDLPAADDRYVRDALRVAPWRSLGLKSGPNLQWVAALAGMARRGAVGWLLLLEPDAVPVGPDVADRAAASVAGHPEAWVIGGLPHPTLLRRLDPDLHDHLNGVALYRVGDADFRAFLDGIWVPSLLRALQDAPHLAYDCLTATRIQERLPDALAGRWRAERHRFVATDGIVNLSAHAGGPLPAGLRGPSGARPWLVHARTVAAHPCVGVRP